MAHEPLGSIRARCITFARMGMIAFSYDMVGYNDSLQVPRHRFASPQGSLWGLSPMALQTWNSTRAMDFLQSLEDIDPERIGCTGESGGGTQTFMLAGIDPRVRVVAPVNMISAHFQGGCVCENAPGLRSSTYNVEIAALAAPRPMLMVSATGDWTANTPSVEYPAVRSIYRLYDADDRLDWVQVDAPHNYNAGRAAITSTVGSPAGSLGMPNGAAEPSAILPCSPTSGLACLPAGRLPLGALSSDALEQSLRQAARERLAEFFPATPAALLPACARSPGADGGISWASPRPDLRRSWPNWERSRAASMLCEGRGWVEQEIVVGRAARGRACGGHPVYPSCGHSPPVPRCLSTGPGAPPCKTGTAALRDCCAPCSMPVLVC